jgi:small subunit ribosomal protein S9
MNEKDYTYGVGRRKSASARVRLYKGKGESMINGKPASGFFGVQRIQKIFSKPLEVSGVSDSHYFTAKVSGGGTSSQAEAVSLGLARAIILLSKDGDKKILKKHGLLTRDPRIRQRRMVGTGGKARRKKQSPKR